MESFPVNSYMENPKTKPQLGKLFAAYYESVFQQLRDEYDEKTKEKERNADLQTLQMKIDQSLDVGNREQFYILTRQYIALKEGK